MTNELVRADAKEIDAVKATTLQDRLNAYFALSKDAKTLEPNPDGLANEDWALKSQGIKLCLDAALGDIAVGVMESLLEERRVALAESMEATKRIEAMAAMSLQATWVGAIFTALAFFAAVVAIVVSLIK